MKKIFVFLLAVMAVMSVSAQTKLTLGGQSANGNWSWGTTKTMGAAVAINFSSQWGEFKLAAEPGDATGCKLVVAEPNAKVNIVVKYADGSDTQYIGVDATEKEITFPSAASLVELQGTEAGAELEVKSFVLVSADGTQTQTSYSEVWGVATYGGIYTSTSQWAQVMLNGAEQADPQIITFHCNAPIPAGLQLKVLNEDGSESYLQLTEGETEPAIEIDNAVKEVSLQFTVTDATIDIAYVTTEPVSTEPTVVSSWTATACKAYPTSWGWDNDIVVSGYDCTVEQVSDGSYNVLAWDGVEGDNFNFIPNQWGIDYIEGESEWAGMYMERPDYYYTQLYVPYAYVGGLGEDSGYIILYGWFYKDADDYGTWGTTYLAWGDYVVIPEAEATYAQTEDTDEPAVAVQFNEYTTCFYDTHKYNNVDVTLVDANGTSYEIVRTDDNYQLADYSCDVTSFILGAELPAGDYTLTIPAGAMVVDDAVDHYVFNDKDYVLNFSVSGAAPAKLINKGTVDAINNVAVQSSSVKKSLRNGKLVIVKGNNEYNAAGALLK